MRAIITCSRPFEAFYKYKVHTLFENAAIFGVDLYEYNIGEKAEDYFDEMSKRKGC